MKSYLYLSLLTAGLLGASALATAEAATGFPDRAVRIIVPFPPGGTVDILPRIVGAKLSETWNQSVVIENRPGAGGNIGADVVARSAPDGYTLLVAPPGPLAVNESLFKNLSYTAKDFTPVTVLGAVPNVLAVRGDLPVDSLKDFIAYAKQGRGKVTMATQGNGTTSHLTSAMFENRTGVEFTYVPYKGTSPALTDLMGGQVDAFFDNIGSMHNHHKGGKVKVLAVAGDKRNPLLPDVPSFAEAGIPDFNTGAWFGMVAPPETPKAVADKINAAVIDALKSDEVQQKFLEQGADVIGNSPAQMAEFVSGERARWKKVIEDANVTVN